MKIDTYLNGIVDKYVKQQNKTNKSEKASTQTQDTPKTSKNEDIDKVEISPQAKLLAQLKGDEESKAQRLEEVKAKLENGSYKPNIEAIANSIVKEWKGE
ncbi:flagellar biosynthesis anti-sigma factor FlgM [Hippea maritima]|uniref:Negative regulator of flagellin synthesis n=1 Tax=Hippea maritima (strain ATCC 700847 / DSM 10411 / MH2) TaxID=760142 RepID=F2LY24_HIPMA|nr:flagellar biosynthesis anti-sigma factor FlgM [Hippea maritima]AEA33289.1 flagellar biosynthesis anti-sigma factor protein FlgM [Hippea maritima DSM 10411]